MTNFISLLTIDVEDWFQVENLKKAIDKNDWNSCNLRVYENINRILDLLEVNSATATFFVLGWIAEKIPQMISEIYKRGHEIASHGFDHQLISSQSQKEFKEDLKISKVILEEIIDAKVIGYRAPSFSITDWAIDLLKEEGFMYDSSFCPTTLHNRYGRLDLQNIKSNSIFQFPNGLIEVPISTVNLLKKSIPWAGGAYFRLMPYSIFRSGVKNILNRNKIYTFYFHPWEIDYEQPRIKNIKLNYRIRHYTGLKSSYKKIEKLLKEFQFVSIKRYLEENNFNKK